MGTSSPTGLFTDPTGSTSSGRVNGTMVVFTGLLIALSGAVLAFFEVVGKSGTGLGIIVIGSGVGLVTTGLTYMGYHKTQETKLEVVQNGK